MSASGRLAFHWMPWGDEQGPGTLAHHTQYTGAISRSRPSNSAKTGSPLRTAESVALPCPTGVLGARLVFGLAPFSLSGQRARRSSFTHHSSQYHDSLMRALV